MAAARAAWRRPAPTLDPTRQVFLDETGVRTDLLRRYGRGRRGVRIHDTASDGRWHTTTLLAGQWLDGLTAPAVFDGPIDGARFRVYIEQVLAPTLAPGDLVIFDNLSCNQRPAVREAIEAVGAHLWFLPKYGPSVNPIELCFAKPKAILRAARHRLLEAIWHTVGQCLFRFTAAECHSCSQPCGYSAADVRS